jgi:hypothetical protein
VSFAVGIVMELIGYVPRYFSATKNPYAVIYVKALISDAA